MDSRDNAKILNKSQAEGFADEKADKCAFKTPQDFKMFDKKTQRLNKSQAEGFCDDFLGCQAVGEGIYLSGNEQAHRADSRKSAQNKRSEVSLEKPTPH